MAYAAPGGFGGAPGYGGPPVGYGGPPAAGYGGPPSGGRPMPILQPFTPLPSPVQTGATDITALTLPYDLRERTVLQHRVRNPHRRHTTERLERVTAHWVDLEIGTALRHSRGPPLELGEADGVRPPAQMEDLSNAPDTINVRAFLPCGVQPAVTEDEKELHILRRMEVVGCQMAETESSKLTAYGGLTRVAPDSELIQQLIRMVREQCGLDLSPVRTWRKLCELTYTDLPGTIYFAPDISEVPKECRFVQHQVCIEGTEDHMVEVIKPVEVPVPTEDGSKWYKWHHKTERKREQRPKRMTKVQPMKYTMASLRDFQVSPATHIETMELCTAADAYDEWIRRDVATNIVTFLHKKKEISLRKAEERKQLARDQASRKRHREEQTLAAKRRREDQEREMRLQWGREDQGKTEEAIRALDEPRQAELRVIYLAEREAASKLLAEEQEANRKAIEPPQKPGKVVTRKIERNQEIFDFFQFVDRPRELQVGMQIAREILVNVLLCVKEERTLAQLNDLLTLGGTVSKVANINYGMLATEELLVETDVKDVQQADAVPLDESQVQQAETQEERLQAEITEQMEREQREHERRQREQERARQLEQERQQLAAAGPMQGPQLPTLSE